ncbi:hypothetical protein BJ875DRAFT_459083 [Amylocarpus encephaloides]|uniref:Uncharacterized protein n=1 Tax=Amylocarpus encephaloides TaxID=45428 RepID=A0A9P8C688_9HELO|nr:hypothetical protein BJ875DRAFT_459083 [Amylocarpus encephaloides]
MSTLHTLGFGHGQTSPSFLTSYPSPRFQKPTPIPLSSEITEDNKDVLIERLNDLVLRLSKEHSLEDKVVTKIHKEVDGIEGLLKGDSSSRKTSAGLNLEVESRWDGSDTFWGPITPTRSIRMTIPMKASAQKEVELEEKSMSPKIAARIAKEAEELATSLAKGVAELQTRREEADRIHDLLVTKVEAGAERILFLEYRIAEMEDDFEANQSELKFLRMQMRALETQCYEYIPRERDEELAESIKNWKIDWEDIDRRSKARRKKCLKVSHIGDKEPVLSVS